MKAFIAYIDRDLHRLNTAHEALSKIPKRKRTADDKARLAAVADEIHITTTHVSMLESLWALDQMPKGRDNRDLVESGQGNPKASEAVFRKTKR